MLERIHFKFFTEQISLSLGAHFLGFVLLHLLLESLAGDGPTFVLEDGSGLSVVRHERVRACAGVAVNAVFKGVRFDFGRYHRGSEQ